jgi:hypothetical protein
MSDHRIMFSLLYHGVDDGSGCEASGPRNQCLSEELLPKLLGQFFFQKCWTLQSELLRVQHGGFTILQMAFKLCSWNFDALECECALTRGGLCDGWIFPSTYNDSEVFT